MRILVETPRPGGLLLCGVPFAPGALAPGSGLSLTANGVALPLWWEERAWWQDGSVKWAWLHGRLVDAGGELVLASAAGAPAVLASPGACSVEVGDVGLWCEGNRIVCRAGGLELSIHPEPVRTEPSAPTGSPSLFEILEPSAIAPLVRWRSVDSAGVRVDHLLRLDPVGQTLYWQQRVSFLTAEPCSLCSLGARIQGGGPSGTFALDGQEHQSLTVLRPGRYRLDQEQEQEGRPPVALHGGDLWLTLEKGWQRSPCAIEARSGEVRLALYPEAAPPLIVQPGTSFRHAVRLALGREDQAPVAWHLDPEQACSTGACGPLMARGPRTERLFPGYEQALEAGLQGARLSRLDRQRGEAVGPAAALADEEAQDEEYFGLQHYGDWPMALGAYGGQRRMYADNEYDTPYAFFLQFLRTGRSLYREVAGHGAVHLADVDAKATDGDLRYHAYYDQAEDHAAHRPPGGDLGHYWTDGLVLNYLLCGDLWSWEAALALARFLVQRFAGTDDDAVRRHFLGCERAVGWPLTALAGVAEVSGDPEVMHTMQRMAGYLARFTADPDRELEEVTRVDGHPLRWWRICQEDGTKPFMLGVVLEGLERYHRLTGDSAAALAVQAICRFLVEVMWVPGIEAFVYEWNAFNRSHREEVYPHYINMMVAPGLAYGYELSGDPRFREVATRAFHGALWTLFAPGGGKEIGMVGRTSALMVGRLYQWRQADEEARAGRQHPSAGVSFAFAGSAEALNDHPALTRRAGQPRYSAGALVSEGDSFAVYAFQDPVTTDRGEVAFTFTPAWTCPSPPAPVAQRAYLHLCDRPFTRSCVSVISFYTALHVRFYDAERNYVEVLEAEIRSWRQDEEVAVRIRWDVDAGEATLWLNGQKCDRRKLGRRLSGAFQVLHLGHRPGNWRADGLLDRLELRLG
ncbi:MAG: hypothetical protein WDA75_19965 [Candidatus Latescibacterota bacterium]